jgi:TRAP-type mannitol/chloroaromatic compound transport system permease large subunit
LIGATLFSLVFRGLGGEETVKAMLEAIAGGQMGALLAVMAVIFVMGFFLDFVEITIIVIPIVGPVLLMMGIDPIWLAVLIALNLQTSFLSPPVAMSAFYLKGVAPKSVTLEQIFAGVMPHIYIVLAVMVLVYAFPGIALWLPDQLYR